MAPDGDGLAGAVFPAGLTGDLLLATLTFQAIGAGATEVGASATPGDLTEGFPLDPSGFDADVSFTSARVEVPEPGLPVILALAALTQLLRRRQAATAVVRSRSAMPGSGTATLAKPTSPKTER